ncbi:Vam6/Vps39-like protein [Mactra antiquata]
MNVGGHGAKTDAYVHEKVQSFKRLGYTVECMTAYDDVLLIAVKGDQLLKYKVEYVYDTNKSKYNVRLSGPVIIKVFGKPVSEIKAIQDHFNLLIGVHDNMLNFYDLEYYTPITTIHETKNFNQYAVSVRNENDSQGIYGPNLKICVTIGKKLMVFEWNGIAFISIISDLVLAGSATKLLWCKKFLIVGLKDEYLLLDPVSGECKDLCKFGNSLKVPLMLGLEDTCVSLQHDNTSMMMKVRDDGKLYDSGCITWTGIPEHIVYDSPYLLAVLSRYVEVRTIDPSVSIQQMELRHVINVCHGKGVIFIQCKDGLYMLSLRPLVSRIKYMIKSRNYDVAIQLQEQQMDLTMEEIMSKINNIQSQQAVYLFTVMKFRESMKLFSTLQIDPSHVIGMFPDLLPSTLKNSIEYPEKIPTLHDPYLTKALSDLVEYLLKKQCEILKETEFRPFTPIMVTKRNNTLKSKEQALSVIDTTLLKCYIKTNIACVTDILLHPNNCVHYDAAEKALKQADCYLELILLYKQNKNYETALTVMKEQASKSKSPLYGIQPTIKLLQELGKDHIKLILEFSEWVLKEDPYEGIKIFTRESPSVKELPRDEIAKFIQSVSPLVLVEYLEHLIYEWKDDTDTLHVMLIDKLISRITEESKLQALVHLKDFRTKAGTEDGMLGILRLKLINFLKITSVYDPVYVWSKLHLDSFYEERAIVLGHMGKHEEALGVYVYVLEDLLEADDYCHRMYNEGITDIYLYLLKVYLNPPPPLALGITDFHRQPKAMAQHAMLLIESQATRIDMLKAIELLPGDIKVKKSRAVLDLALNVSVSKCYMSKVLRNMQYLNYLQTCKEHQEECCTQKMTISDNIECKICKLKIGPKTVFVRNSEGDLIHYGCYGNMDKT